MDMNGHDAKGYEAGGIALVGCILLGAGVGLLTGHWLPATIIGAGSGFIAMALFRWR